MTEKREIAAALANSNQYGALMRAFAKDRGREASDCDSQRLV